MEANVAKHDASSSEAKEPPISDPDPMPEPNPNPNKIPLRSPEANEQDLKHQSGGNESSSSADKNSCPSTSIKDRAKSHLQNSRAAEAVYGSPLDWPELQTIWQAFESTWGTRDRPMQTNDPRVRVVLERFSSGRTPEELSCAIRASKRYAPVAQNPCYQRIKTILKDDEQVDNLLRLESAPTSSRGRVPLKQQGGWKAPETERVACE
jgi:hypothetical protein